jgi:hypothetical protein
MPIDPKALEHAKRDIAEYQACRTATRPTIAYALINLAFESKQLAAIKPRYGDMASAQKIKFIEWLCGELAAALLSDDPKSTQRREAERRGVDRAEDLMAALKEAHCWMIGGAGECETACDAYIQLAAAIEAYEERNAD